MDDEKLAMLEKLGRLAGAAVDHRLLEAYHFGYEQARGEAEMLCNERAKSLAIEARHKTASTSQIRCEALSDGAGSCAVAISRLKP